LTSKELKAKGEIDFLNDKLLQGGQLGEVKTGINYREVRQYDNGTSVVKFYFATRCYSDHLESVLNELKTMQPHAVIMNSCLWDLHRYGPRGPDSYHVNMKKLMVGLKKVIPSDAVFIWNATLPLDSKCKGGFLLPYYE
ncbi:PC-esterase domain-containing protein 1A-like, partial [Actinia tenebrosa]